MQENGLYSSVARVTRNYFPSAPAVITAASRDTSNFDTNDTDSPATIAGTGGSQARVGGERLGSGGGTAVIVDTHWSAGCRSVT